MTKKPTDAEMVFFLCPFASLSPWFSSSILVSLSYSSSSSSSLYSCFSAFLLSYISFLFVLLICFIFLLALLLVPSPSFFPFPSPSPRLHSSPAGPPPPSFSSFLLLPTRIIIKESKTTRKGREKWKQRTVTQPHPPLNKRTNKHTNKTKHPSKTT